MYSCDRSVSYTHLDVYKRQVHQVVVSPVEKHSQKPDIVRDKIEELMGNLPKIELFARQQAEGWDCWGNEV